MKSLPFLVFLSSILLSSCVTNVKYSGHAVDKDELAQLKINESTKDSIRELIGAPSVESDYGTDIWFYVFSKMEYIGFIPPKVVERDVIAIAFNKNNTLSEIQTFTLDNANNIKISTDATLSTGTSGTLVNHFLKNLGRFNALNHKKTMPGRPKGI